MVQPGEAQRAVPWFWSDQYDVHLQIAGVPRLGVRVVERCLPTDTLLRFHLDGRGRLVGAAALGALSALSKDMRVARMLIARGATPDPAALSAPDRRLKTLLAA